MRRIFAVSATLLFAACGAASDQPRDQKAEIDLSRITERLKYGFRVDGASFRGGEERYGVRADRGVVEIVARHWAEDDAQAKPIVAAPLTLETVSIARDRELDLGEPLSAVAQDGSLQIQRGVAIEQFINTPDGTEQSWRFDDAPNGDGDLVIRVRTGGLRWALEDDLGHHFVDDRNNVGVVYGPATWIDAGGARTSIAVAFEDEHLVLTVPADVVANSSFPAVLDPTAGPEINLTTPVAGPSAYPQDGVAVAFDGTNYMVVWADLRDAISWDIYGARVAPGAVPTVLDPTGFIVATLNVQQTQPSIAFNGATYLVVYTVESATTLDIEGQRLSTTGTRFGGPITIAAAPGVQTNPDVTAAGLDFLVTWQDARSGGDEVWAAVVDQFGAIADPPYVVAAGPTPRRYPAATCGDSSCLIVWHDGATGVEDIRGARVQAGAFVMDPGGILIAGPGLGRQLLPDVSFALGQFFVVWQDYRTGTFDIRGIRVDEVTGTLVDAAAILVNGSPGQQQAPSTAWDGTGHVVAWHDSRSGAYDIYATRVSAAGVVGNAAGIAVNTNAATQNFAQVAAAGGNALIIWQDARGQNLAVMGTMLNGTTIGDPVGTYLGTATNRQSAGAAVFDGTNYFVVFNDSRTSGGADYDIVGVRVSADGNTITPPAGQVIGGGPGNQVAPDIAFNGAQFLVVWQDTRNGNYDVYGTRVDALYNVMDPAGIPIGVAPNDAVFPKVAFSNAAARYLVAWGDRRSGDFDMYAARVQVNGTVDDPNGFAVVTAAGSDQRNGDVASNNIGDWLIAYTDNRTGPNTEDIRGVVLLSTGVVNAPDFVISSAANRQESPAALGFASNFLVVWQDNRTLGNYNIMSTRVNRSGMALDTAGVFVASDSQNETRPSLASSGATVLIAWERPAFATARENDIRGRRFSQSNVPLDAMSFSISAGPGSESLPAVAGNSATSAAVFYQVFDGAAGFSSERMRFRMITMP